MPRIVVLIDGFQNLASILGNVQSMEYGPLDWLAELHRIDHRRPPGRHPRGARRPIGGKAFPRW